MRLDILEEYSTLVPFGLGVSKRNRVYSISHRPGQGGQARRHCAGRSKLLLKFVAVLRHIGRREEIRPIH